MNLHKLIPTSKEIHCVHQTRRGSCKYNNQTTPINSRVAHLFIIYSFLFCYVLCRVSNVACLSAFSIVPSGFCNFYLQNNPHISWGYNILYILLLMIKYLRHLFVNWHKINRRPVPDILACDMPKWYEANTRFNCIELLLN